MGLGNATPAVVGVSTSHTPRMNKLNDGLPEPLTCIVAAEFSTRADEILKPPLCGGHWKVLSMSGTVLHDYENYSCSLKDRCLIGSIRAMTEAADFGVTSSRSESSRARMSFLLVLIKKIAFIQTCSGR
jgi:hypothetical protein